MGFGSNYVCPISLSLLCSQKTVGKVFCGVPFRVMWYSWRAYLKMVGACGFLPPTLLAPWPWTSEWTFSRICCQHLGGENLTWGPGGRPAISWTPSSANSPAVYGGKEQDMSGGRHRAGPWVGRHERQALTTLLATSPTNGKNFWCSKLACWPSCYAWYSNWHVLLCLSHLFYMLRSRLVLFIHQFNWAIFPPYLYLTTKK
jgi:hypothetical protein